MNGWTASKLHCTSSLMHTHIQQFGGKGSITHSGGVCLHHTNHFTNAARWQPQAGAHSSYAAVGRGHIRIRSWNSQWVRYWYNKCRLFLLFCAYSYMQCINQQMCLIQHNLWQVETWSLTLREEHRLRVFENRVLRIFWPKRDEVTREWRNYIMGSLMICTPHPILLG